MIYPMLKVFVGFVIFCLLLTFIGELQSEHNCSLLGKEMNLPTKEYYGIPCMIQVNGHWVPARNLRTDVP